MANGNQMATKVMSAILAVVIAGILIGYVFPIGLNAANSGGTANLTQDVNTQYDVTDSVVSNVTGVSASGANFTVNDTDTAESASFTDVSAGNSKTLSWQGGTINVTVENVDTSADTATLKYEYPQTYGWDNAETDIYGLLPIFLVLVPLGVLAAFVMRSF